MLKKIIKHRLTIKLGMHMDSKEYYNDLKKISHINADIMLY